MLIKKAVPLLTEEEAKESERRRAGEQLMWTEIENFVDDAEFKKWGVCI